MRGMAWVWWGVRVTAWALGWIVWALVVDALLIIGAVLVAIGALRRVV